MSDWNEILSAHAKRLRVLFHLPNTMPASLSIACLRHTQGWPCRERPWEKAVLFGYWLQHCPWVSTRVLRCGGEEGRWLGGLVRARVGFFGGMGWTANGQVETMGGGVCAV